MRKKWFYPLIAGIFALNILAACGNGGDTQEQEDPSLGEADQTPAMEEEQPSINNTEDENLIDEDKQQQENTDEDSNSTPEENTESGTGGNHEEGSIHGEDSESKINPETEKDDKKSK